MDGPNTNWEVLRLLKEQQKEEEDPQPFSVGSSRLHVIHDAFQIGNSKTNWNIVKILKAMWQLFRDSAACRYIYNCT